MNIQRVALGTCLIGTLWLAGCEKATAPPEPVTSAPVNAVPAPQSVAIPPSERPPSDMAIVPPVQQAPSSGDAGTPSQTNPTTLTEKKEETAMPLPGQVNNHSTPDTTSPTGQQK